MTNNMMMTLISKLEEKDRSQCMCQHLLKKQDQYRKAHRATAMPTRQETVLW